MSVTPLINSLESIIACYLRLIELGESKKQVLIQNKVDQLNAIVNQENKVIKELEAAEKEREVTVRRYFREKGLRIRIPTTIDDLVKATVSMQDKQRLSSCGERLREAAAKLQETNHANQELLQQMMDYVQYSLDLLVPDDDVTYQNPVRSSGGTKNARMFDTKA
ncbi:hypothetical protein XYCOK13_27900 [Xylanibacillus composti]|uniref:Flagellar protein FlgN n=1 Tax=Xylanibacillus composti TaxID=1572762 RepID=A0A8J4M3X5_9BACL|nr:flagellar protein FlgN [Xylanibacillus composti]GIQ69966.1 hypothetical protein XYCOK13_27900 [Xylanibacillus composti]